MRTFSIMVACLALAAGIGCVSVVSRFRAMYDDMGATLPNLTATFLNTSGWIPGGMFLILAGLLIALVEALKKPRASGIVAVATLLLLIGTAVALPRLLLMPLSHAIRDVEASRSTKKAEQVGAGQTTTRSKLNSEGGDKPQPESDKSSR